jgi:teichoic acid transport system ATP-binding protein
MAVTDAVEPLAPPTTGDPAVIVEDIHINYRVYGGRARATSQEPSRGLVRRLLGRTDGHMGSASEIHAVRGVSFIANHGETIGIVGRNGSGKSTLLRGVAGLVPLTQGNVYVSGQTSLLGVNAVLMRDLTGEQNIMVGGLALGLSKKQVREEFDDIVEFSGVGEFVYMPMQSYSSGMGARLRFAISSAARPDILMIDEALATGDAAFKERSKARINDIRQHAGTIFFVSHSLSSVREMCTRVIWLDKGELKMDGPTDEVCDAYHAFIKQQTRGKVGSAKPAKSAKPKKA